MQKLLPVTCCPSGLLVRYRKRTKFVVDLTATTIYRWRTAIGQAVLPLAAVRLSCDNKTSSKPLIYIQGADMWRNEIACSVFSCWLCVHTPGCFVASPRQL
jgi:hypothetical protein